MPPEILFIRPRPRTLILRRNRLTIDVSANHHNKPPINTANMAMAILSMDASAVTKSNCAKRGMKRKIISGLDTVIANAVTKS